MSTTMDQIHHIRQLFFEQGKNLTEIASETGLNWKTVRKYIDQEDFSEKPPEPKADKTHHSKLDPYKQLIDGWLEEDKRSPRKQRHTAKRIFQRLCNEVEGFDCSYRTVANYVSQAKRALNLKQDAFYLPLIHHAGESQGDFGNASFYENGKLWEGQYFVLSFPNSNAGFLRLGYGANMEFLLESLRSIFEYIGGVPPQIWFDNDGIIVNKILKDGTRKIYSRFKKFQEHYRFKAIFMNPESGYEKGNVENKVGYLRRNLLVPIPHFEDLDVYNKALLEKCTEDHKREHYDKESTISEIFNEDRTALIPLPSTPFDTMRYMRVQTNKYGKFTLHEGKHEYSASPAYCQDEIDIALTSKEVIVFDDHNQIIVTHPRMYGEKHQKSMDWLPYLQYIAKKPRSIHNSGIYDMMPGSMQKFMDQCTNSDRGTALKTLAELTKRSGFDSAVNTVEEAIRLQTIDPDSLKNLYRRLYSDIPELPPLSIDAAKTEVTTITPNTDLKALDSILQGGDDHD